MSVEVHREAAFEALLPNAPFREFHQRQVLADPQTVWRACLDVAGRDVRVMGPLMALRSLPSLLVRRELPGLAADTPLLDLFARAGFLVVRRDEALEAGRASAVLVAVGRFWKLAHNEPLPLRDADEFRAFAEPGYAKVICRLDAIAEGERGCRVETETCVAGTDAAAAKVFGRYWAVIRPGSGWIRRSWLAAIDRRARRTLQEEAGRA